MPDQPTQDMRRDYTLGILRQTDLAPDPLAQFRRWFDEAVAQNDGQWFEPNAMQLATVDEHGTPTTRTVLLKEIDDDAIVFYTNYDSRKGRDIAAHPTVAATFYWPQLERQVNLVGRAERTARDRALAYFRKRPRENQLGALISPQSTVVPDRATLEQQLDEAEAAYDGQDIPLPDHWGGYRIIIDVMEFWQGGAGRLHDRLRYRRNHDGAWLTERLAP
jgi:pyridoxamine 5'-phosphate oxidase